MKQLEAIDFDAAGLVKEAKEQLPYQMTRAILAQETLQASAEVTEVRVVAAYQTAEDLKADFCVSEEAGDIAPAELGLAIGSRLAIIDASDGEDALKRAVELAHAPKFLEARQDLYEWQEDVIARGVPAKRAVNELNVLVDKYNHAVSKANAAVYHKLVFTLAAIALGLPQIIAGNIAAAGGALLAMVRFAKFDRTPVITPGKAVPAAMVHEARSIIKWEMSNEPQRV
jgi:hypothetical protein